MEIQVETIFNLIRRQGTLEQVSSFLRLHGLSSSAGSWDDMIGARLRPAFEKKQLSITKLVGLLRQTEEHGAQHIFLYDALPNRTFQRLFEGDLNTKLKEAGFPELGTTSIVDMPDKPTVVEVREEVGRTSSIVFKIVEKRDSLEKAFDTAGNGQFVVTYNVVPYRAVNIMRVSENGMADIRIQSHTDAISYNGLSESCFTLLKPLVDRLDWKDHKLDKLKSNLFDTTKRQALMTVFGLRAAQHSNVQGTRVNTAVGGIATSMYDDEAAVATLDKFLEKKDQAHCERASVTFKKNEVLKRSVSLVFAGEPNEFAITSKVSKAEYEYILEKVLEHNK